MSKTLQSTPAIELLDDAPCIPDANGHTCVMASVTLESDAAAQFVRLPARIKPRVERLFARLARWPTVSGAKPLRGELAGRFRLRTGDYRLQFRVEGSEVIVEQIGHRDGFYGG